MEEGEIWAEIFGYPDYEVSTYGRVYNSRLGRMLQQSNRNGYLGVNLIRNQKSTTMYVHRLVAFAFLIREEGCLQVNHIDGDRQYNVIDNLEWCTQSRNMKHAYEVGLWSPTNKRPIRIIENGMEFSSLSECARFFNITPSSVYSGLNDPDRKVCGFTLEYLDRPKQRKEATSVYC